MKFLLVLLAIAVVSVQGFPPLLAAGPIRSHVREGLMNRLASHREHIRDRIEAKHNATGQDSCPSWKERVRAKPGKQFCCDSTIKTVVETGMKTLDLFGVGGPKTLGPIVQSLSSFVQRHFQVAFEIIMAPKNFQLNTNYNGTKICKFESNNYMLAVYETPGDYDINSPAEAYFYNFAANDKLHLPDVSHHLAKFANIAGVNTGSLSSFGFGRK